jgi:hypothetical protein
MARRRSPTHTGTSQEGGRPQSWLARSPVAPDAGGRPWRPSTLRGLSARRLRYVVVDEVFADIAELSLSSWPVLDAQGRLRFPDAAAADFEVDAARMRTFLRRHRMPRKAAGRPLRTGDAFGFVVDGRGLEAFLEGLGSPSLTEAERGRLRNPATWEWLATPIFDVSSEAREAAKLSHNAALAQPLPEQALEKR